MHQGLKGCPFLAGVYAPNLSAIIGGDGTRYLASVSAKHDISFRFHGDY